MKNSSKNDYFNIKWQKNARINKNYENIANSVEKCVFCDLRKKYVIKTSSNIVLTVNIFPYINGQLIIVPKRHIEHYSKLTLNELNASNRLIKLGMKLLKKVEINNTWVIFRDGPLAGKTVKHFHWNIMPYIEGLNTWHYQKITVAPEKLATKLRKLA